MILMLNRISYMKKIHTRKTMKPLSFILMLFCVALSPISAQNITDLAVMSDRTATTEDLDDWTEGPTIADSVFLHPDRIRYDSRCLQIEGKDVFLFSGTFHYFRTPEPLWRDRMEKIKAAGFNCVETYVPWNWHEREMPTSVNDFSKVDLSELEHFLTLAEEQGLYVIVRPGPYICSEWSGGGFPQWIMQKRPAKTKHEVWLQSDDPVFMAWNEHWYKAVARVTEPHQIYHRQPNTGGVVLWQLENEFNRVKWIPSKCKRAYLEELARISRRCGIEVPFITCWTDQARNVKEGPLNGVLDMVNSYPRWQIRKGFGRLINQQLKSQGGKPLISGELQGGWSSDLGTPISWDMDGQTPAQTQNITLYALQRGFCALNFYMLVGGTNFEDWAARNQTASYDFAAAIGEDGSLNERYYRFKSLAEFIHEHGTRIARCRIEPVAYQSTDSLVELTVRRHPDGTRYLFVRTEEHTHPHKGTLSFLLDGQQQSLDFNLEAFGSRVYVLDGQRAMDNGQWFPHEVEHTGKPQPHKLVQTLVPQRKGNYSPLFGRRGGGEASLHYRRNPILYKVNSKVKQGGTLTIERVGKNQMNRTEADVVLAFADKKSLPITAETDTTVSFNVPKGTKSLTFIYDSRGLHHHTNKAVEQHWHIGPAYVTLDGQPVKLTFTDAPLLTWTALISESVLLSKGNHSLHQREGEGRAFWLRLSHKGDGFVYLNGHCLGRCYEHGPQNEYYLPECWLRGDGTDTVSVALLPTAGAEVTEMSLTSQVVYHQSVSDYLYPGGRWGDQGDGTFRNPILRADYSDPDPLRVGDDYYMVASTFEDYPGLVILHSRDLVNWQTIGHAFHHLADVSEDYTWRRMNRYNGGVYAPTISYYDGRFYIYANLYTDGFYMATATDPAGPWTEQLVKDKYDRPLRVLHWSDPCPFWDDDGKAYLMSSHPGREYWYSYLFQMSADGTQLLDADSAHIAQQNTLYQWPDGGTCVSPYHSSEGNRIFKKDGYYYLQHIEFTNKGQGEGTYIARSRHIYGTHEDGTPGTPGNPGKYEMKCIERVYSRDSMLLPGQGGYVTTADGRWWWIGQFTRDYPEGRTPWLVPVKWVDDWPVMTITPIQMEKPAVVSSSTFQVPCLPQGSDDFSANELSPRWRWNHVPHDNCYSLTERHGWLRLHAFKAEGKQKGFFGASGTLMQHAMPSDSTVVTIRIDASHLAFDGHAGLAVFNGGKSFACIDVNRLYLLLGDVEGAFLLRVHIDKDGLARFSYSTDGLTFTPYGEPYQLVAGNFRGSRVGIFCYNDNADGGYADIDYFDYYVQNR